MMKQGFNGYLSSALSLTLILQLAIPVQAFAGGAVTEGKLNELNSKNISTGNAPKNTKDYLEDLCNGIDQASKGTVGPDAALKLTQQYDLESSCKNQSKLPDIVKTYCTLHEAVKTSQVKQYCEARKIAIKADNGSKIAYKLDIAAAGTCWAEYLLTKAKSSVAAGVADFTKGRVCGAAAMSAGVAELATTVSMAFKDKGKKVTEDGTVKKRDDVTYYGGMLMSMGIGVTGVFYGKCLLTGKGCGNVGHSAYHPKNDPVIDVSELITTFARYSPEFRDSVAATLQGDYFDRWKRSGNLASDFDSARLTLESEPVLLAGGASVQPVVKKFTIPTDTSTTTTIKRTVQIEPQKTIRVTEPPKIREISPEEMKRQSERITNMRKQLEEEQLKRQSTPEYKKMVKKAKGEGTGNFERGNDNKDVLIFRAAIAFTALAGMRYLARDAAKKTRENAESFLNSMISEQPTLASNITYTAGKGYKAGSGYVGSTNSYGGDTSGLTGSPEEILAPRGSPQREAFDKVAAQIPESVSDSAPGAAIGQIAGAMGANNSEAVAHADDVTKTAYAALGTSSDIYATEGGGGGGNKKSGGEGGLNLNLGGNTEQQLVNNEEMNFRAPASQNCQGDIFHAQCKTNMNMFQIVSDRYSTQPIAKEAQGF